MMHLEVYSGSIASGTSPLIVVPGIASQIYPPSGSGFLVQGLNKILYAMQVGAGAVRAQLQSASLRVNPFIDVVPSNRGTLFASPVRFADFSKAPLQVRSNEELDVFATQNSGAGAQTSVGVWFADGPQQSQRNVPNLTVHATAAVTLTALAWSTVGFALDTSLDPGTYLIVGMRVFSATGLWARVVPNTQQQVYRPGVPMVQAYDGYDFPYGDRDDIGPFITFATTALPKFELFATAADVAEELWLDLVQVSTSLAG